MSISVTYFKGQIYQHLRIAPTSSFHNPGSRAKAQGFLTFQTQAELGAEKRAPVECRDPPDRVDWRRR